MFEPITKYMCLTLLDYQKNLILHYAIAISPFVVRFKILSNLLLVFPEPTVYQEKKTDCNHVLQILCPYFIHKIPHFNGVVSISRDQIPPQFEDIDIVVRKLIEKASHFSYWRLENDGNTPSIVEMCIHFLNRGQPVTFLNIIENMGTKDEVITL